jgi:hypothetical protein
MSAMQEAQLGSSMQLQKHVAVMEATQPALVIVVVEQGLKHLDDMRCPKRHNIAAISGCPE